MQNFEENREFTSVKAWAEDDRPREKLIKKGKAALSDAELLAILMNTGTRNETVVDLSKRLLASVNYDLAALSRLSLKDLMRFKGVGEAKAVTISAALELGRRRRDSEVGRKPKISSSKDAYEYLASSLSDLPHEEFWILLLNKANTVIGKYSVSAGGFAGTVADQRIIFKKALEEQACGIILAHNHPSGNLKPSQADIKLTKTMKESGNILDIPVFDHLIITASGYFSFADEGML
ncbi:MAG: DNA repair protein RadC [Flavobacteriales bacterium]|nr:DNA repair protein RadC [Flavobacteriales bacterium]